MGYQVKLKIDSQWVKDERVFGNRDEADKYGNLSVETVGAEDYRIVETDEPISEPVTEEESGA